ncbi:NlpC/P60 family protein [Geodermatophilus saharensis]|uniref:NlpC/P60 family protein n=1 Tax=Geodermatophilus saharensis TaxID=1137994 RepID=A0A239ECV0_9ACTN|nr:NlpC/P60 family protein [Geodermatophilus saharensis]
MTTARTSTTRRSFRGIAVAAIAGAGIVLSPLPASANSGGGTATATVAAAPAVAPNAAAQVAVDTALAQVGDPYVYGATGPNAFDCSGLTSFAYKAAGISIPRTSKLQSTFGTAVAKSDLQPGDLVFFYSPVSHVGMYIGNGQMVHASTAGKPVAVVDLDSMPSYAGARRVA